MAETTYLEKEHASYIESGCWICTKSPTGAHYWKEVIIHEHGIFVCKYCYEVREFPTTFDDAKRIIGGKQDGKRTNKR